MAVVLASSALLFAGLTTGRTQTNVAAPDKPPVSAAPAAPAAPAPTAGQAAPSAPAHAGQGSPGLKPGDVFGEEVTLSPKTMIYIKGTATWDTAFDSLIDAFKSVQGYLDREKLKASGSFMTIYTATDDTSFQFKAGVPVETAPKEPPQGDLAVGTTPEGRALKFVHRGPYDAMDATYDAITNYLDDKKLDAKDLFVEQYATDPLTTPQESLVIEIYVPVQSP